MKKNFGGKNQVLSCTLKEKNTKFLQSLVNGRKNRSSVNKILKSNGNWDEGREQELLKLFLFFETNLQVALVRQNCHHYNTFLL